MKLFWNDDPFLASARFQAPAGGAGTTASGGGVATIGTQDQTPVATMGYGARESADAKRQQVDSQMAHDEPEDINVNAVVARSQVLTFDTLGKNYESNQDSRQKMQDSNTDFRQKMQDRFLSKVV